MGRMGVRKLPLGIMLSAAIHVAVVAWIGTRTPAPRATRTTATTPIAIVVVDKPPSTPATPPELPINVTLLPSMDDREDRDARPAPPSTAALRPENAPASPSRSPAGSAHAAQPEAALAVPDTGATPETAPPRPPGRSNLMTMRRGDVPRPVLPAGRWDDLDHAPRGTTPEKDLTTGILEESGAGTYRSDQGVFVGKVSPDGSVKLTDRPNLHVHVALPTPKSLGRALAGWYESDKGPYGAGGDTAMARQIQVSPGASTEPHDPVDPRSKDHTTTVIVPMFAGGFDTTDWLMRRHGQDPYAAKKLAFLDATRDERVQIGNRHRARQLALTPQLVQNNLDALWAATQDAQARKQALFELWDECTETGDPAAVEAGNAARRIVIGFIRAHLPAGSPDAYTPAELAALARQSHAKAAFQPYE